MDFAQARIMHERGQIDEAIQAYDEMLNKDFDNIDVLFFYGTALFQRNQYGLAANILKRVLESRPTMQSAYQNLGNCFKASLDYKSATEVYKMGLALGDESQLFCCMGSMNINVGTPQEALNWYSKGLAMDPGNDIIRYNMGLAYLELGQWEKGFDFYDKGFSGGNRSVRKYGVLPEWDGNKEDTVIVWGEQGLGDEVMFASIIPDLQKNCKRVIFDCHPRLVDTFTRSFGIECHGTRKNHFLEWLPKSDATSHVSITTLAKYFRKKDKDFPGTPYLVPDEKQVSKHRRSEKLRVGISWEGGTHANRTDLRSIPLQQLEPLLEDLDVDFFSLQYTPSAAREIHALEEKTGIHLRHFPGLVETPNYDTTVNFVASLDLVITVCTSIFHVAGALGVPVWCMVPWGPAWRYGVKGETVPWYKSARLFRQAKGEDWNKVIERVQNELDKRILQRAEQKAA